MSNAQIAAAVSLREEIIAAYRDGCTDTRALALRFGVSTRTIDRALRGIRPPRLVTRSYEEEVIDAARELLADGMPANWVAETLQINYDAVVTLSAHMPGRRQLVSEWQSVWGSIYNSQALLDLHREFAPRG